MSEEDGAEKSYEPTQRRLDEARRKGEVPRSADAATAAGYLGFLVAALAFGPASLLALGTTLMLPLDRADALAGAIFGTGPHPASGRPLAGGLLTGIGAAMAPWLLLPGIFALLAYVAQQALVFAPSRIAPKADRLSPLQGIKQKFGRNGLFEFAKSAVKLTIYGLILGLFVWMRMPTLVATLAMDPVIVTAQLGQIAIDLMWIVVIVAAALALIDVVWQRGEHRRRHMMSRKELRDEMKESEGDPQLKQQRRQKGVSLALNQMLAEVPKADVVIVNPVHYAVALGWDRAGGGAPVCLAKGTDEIALRIREIAVEHAIPIHADPPTARALHAALDLGDEIATEHYKAVAAAIRFADRLRAGGGRR
ncbi:EscU/YscU/HrcU family type III secretion system export apparatus switch protein [Wenxinia saemankumensis]|uniref:Flagellar biosynthetic protein FlhB n=1 Tax=Wenxinia saemankumensis TaxID=1447782 RepID=A0A1M6G6F3_9RHOB|nr:flagellar type III secretion system protein FlhB [Wenxinia saemankumensis]SHJ05519.1 flagellar biosynthetic protein FlhB [Wenxinia saemankumensis]